MRLGGFITQTDPIGIAGGLNTYGYAGGDPINFSDPFGLDPCKSSSAWTECLAQGLANFGARRGGSVGSLALNGGALLNAASEALGVNFAASLGDAIGSGDIGEATGDVATAAALGLVTRGLLGRNPALGSGRINTDLPGGRATAKSIFGRLTRGMDVEQHAMPGGGVRRVAPDGTQIRMHADGRTRIDRIVGEDVRETIHFNR